MLKSNENLDITFNLCRVEMESCFHPAMSDKK